MMSKRNKHGAKRGKAATGGDAGFEFVRPWLLAAFAAVCVARPLLPSEGVSWLGDDLPFDMLLLILAGGTFAWAAVRGALARPLQTVDGCVAALVAVCVASALVNAWEGTPRNAINMLWVWVGQGLVFVLTRQLVRTAREARALVAVMFALASVLAAFGFYQVFASLPADRAAYAADPEQVMLRSVGQVYPEGSTERLRFEDRLRSTEPLATFALANSLAGFLAAWLVVALGIGWNMLEARRGGEVGWGEQPGGGAIGPARVAGLLASILAVAACFVLTKSRSAYVAAAVGIALVPFCGGRRQLASLRKFAIASAVAIAVLVGAAVASGRLDAEVLSEAGKSLGFRLQYWRSTLAMIGSYPWFGVGPGNFQDYYTQFKLPEASEEIRDPHNFLLEVWATGGTFALFALLGALGMVAWRVWHSPDRSRAGNDLPEKHVARAERGLKFLLAGACAGFALAFVVGPMFDYVLTEGQLAAGLLIGAGVVASLWPWLASGELPARLPALAALVLAIHFLAAGGIAFPGVAASFWMLLALAFNATEPEEAAVRQWPRASRRRLIPLAGLVLSSSAAVACYYTSYRPVVQLQQAMSQAAGIAHPQARLVAYLDAAQADPLSADPWLAMAEVQATLLKRPLASAMAYQQFESAAEKVRELRPHSSAAWRQLGRWYVEVYEQNQQPEAAKAALKCRRRAVELYPNSAISRGELAKSLETAGEHAAAARQAARALELDDVMPHSDKKLPAHVREQLAELAGVPR